MSFYTYCRAIQWRDEAVLCTFAHSLHDLFHSLYSEKAGGAT